ncbi:MAG: hypothetical protein CMM44_03545 [Rhodospirillaceae bacterium]|nr:hypothetical protein [Rhodospirillaceae bacterium]|tara:strand:- start:15802 stop:17061 length:1260 start_codon:yes stop_codon:yes gene_type:complete
MVIKNNVKSAFGAWTQRNYAWYMGGASVSLFGMWAQRIAVAWLAWELTRSELWLGLIAFADLFPTVIITPIAGAIADRTNRLWMSRISIFLAGCQAFMLAWMAYNGYLTEASDVWWLFFLSLFLGIVMAFATAARLSMVPLLIEPDFLPSALANDAAIFNSARVVGPMLAALIISTWNAGTAFLLNGFVFMIFVCCLMVVRLLRNESKSSPSGNVIADTIEGMRAAAVHQGIGPMLIVLSAVAIGVKSFFDLLPAVSDEVFNAGVDGFAHLAAAGGFGAVSAAIWLAMRGSLEGLTSITLGAMAIGMAGISLMCATDNIWIGLLGSFFGGVAVTLCGTGTQTLMQNAVEGHLRGRIMSIYGMLHRGAPAVGALTMGAAAEIFGVQWALITTCTIVCAPVLLWAWPRRTKIAKALENNEY